jgi:hypothetical protein
LLQGLLVRVGIDLSEKGGKWNSRVDLQSGEFIYMPIPGGRDEPHVHGLKRGYEELISSLKKFGDAHGKDIYKDWEFPKKLLSRDMHLDPDFEYLSYGDLAKRGKKLTELKEGDFIAFYSSFKPISPPEKPLYYALVGFYKIQEIVCPIDVLEDRRKENAHTRILERRKTDIIVRGEPGESARLDKCILIGERRDNAYRVMKNVEDCWGGLCVKNGFLQRSGSPPFFKDPEKFLRWFSDQEVSLIQKNNP